jgi:serine/threonine protein kinase/tetratricopeptide (TPR) repeat protein
VNEREIFIQALEKSSPEDRSAFLIEACGDDADFRQRIELLLRAHDEPDSLLERPVVSGTTRTINGDTDQEEPVPPVDREFNLDFLEPSEDPAHLGRLGQFEVLERIGHGGMGLVLKAHDTRLNRTVAIKLLAPHFAAHATARQRFLREGQAAAAVTHPHVITIHAVDEIAGIPYLVMEYVDGLSLREKIELDGALELKEILRIGSQVAAGLAAAHRHGLIHRDIKPGNILLENGIERVNLTDFGLARAIDDLSITRTGEVAGTPQYMSPEQAQGKAVDQRSDLFSLGSVLYAMCTGRAAFRAESAMAVMHRICHDTPRNIRETNPDIPAWLTVIVDRLLAKDADERFRSADEVAELLGQCLAHVQHPTIVTRPTEVTSTTLEEIVGAAVAGKKPAGEEDWPSAQDDTVLLRPRVARSRPDRQSRAVGRWLMATAALLVLVGLLTVAEGTGVTHVAGTMIRLVTGEGTLIIEVDDPTIQVSIDGDQIRIRGGGVEELRLTPGQYKFTASKDGKPIKTQLVSITRGGKETVRVSLEGPSPEIAATTKERETQPSEETGGDWISLFNGKDLTGWKTHPDAPGGWTVEDGLLVGRCNQATSYLFSERGDFEDFHFRVEVLIGDSGDSGIFFRSESELNGVGWNYPFPLAYEVQIAGKNPVQDSQTGTLADAGRRSLAHEQRVLAPTNRWNTLEIIAQDNRLVVKVNGEVSADTVDAQQAHSKGHLTLQASGHGCVVRFRKIEIRELPSSEPSSGFMPAAERTLADDALAAYTFGTFEPDWVPLFNGKDLAGWKTHPNRPGRWTIEDGAIVGRGPENSLLYSERDDYENFHLRAEVNINDRGNSGILFRSSFGVVDGENVNLPSHSAQAEIANGAGNWAYLSMAYESPTNNHRFEQVVGNALDAGNRDDWRLMELIAIGRRIVIKLDDQVVVDTIDARFPFSKGHLALETYGKSTVVQFRNLQIRELPRNADRLAKAERLLAEGQIEQVADLAVEGIAHCGGEFGTIMDWDEVCEQIAAQRPELTDIWRARGEYFARRSRWNEAAANFQRAWEHGRIEIADELARVHVLRDDREGYYAICRQYLAQQPADLSPWQAAFVAHLYSFGEGAGASPQLVAWAERCLEQERHSHLYAYAGMAFLRAGDFDRAIDCLTTAVQELGLLENAGAFPLALAHHRKGNRVEAREWFDKGLAAYQGITPRDPDLPAPWALSHWLELNVWYREAAREIDPGAFDPDRTAAQWVLDLGGEVAVDTEQQTALFVRPPDKLPEQPFRLTWIKLLDNDQVTDDDLRRLTGLRHLSILNLSGTSVGNPGAAHLTNLPELTLLNLVGTQVTDEGLASLAGNPKLEQLYLSRCPLTDQAMPGINKLKLTHLTLDGTKITFDGLQQLAGHPTLKAVNVAQLGLTEEQLRELSELLPNCQINAESGATEPLESNDEPK